MPEHESLMDRIYADAMKRPAQPLYIDKPFDQWNEEDLAYFARQTCGPIQALNAYGDYRVVYMGDHYQIIEGEQVIDDHVPLTGLRQKIEEIVDQRRHAENVDRIMAIAKQRGPGTKVTNDPRMGKSVRLLEESHKEGHDVIGTIQRITRWEDGIEVWDVLTGSMMCSASSTHFQIIEK